MPGSYAGYSPILVGVLGIKLPYVAEYSLMVTTSPTASAEVIVNLGPSVATV